MKLLVCSAFAAAVVSAVVSYRTQGPYGERLEVDPRVHKEYDSRTGQLALVVFDSDGNLRVDTWSYMAGDRLIRMEVDDDEDGKIDRRSFYGPGDVLERTEHVDAVGRLITTEYFKNDVIVRSEPGTAQDH